MNIEIMNASQAKEFNDFILPQVLEDDNFDKYTFYAAIEDDRLCGLLVCDTVITGPEILSVGVSSEYTGRHIATELITYAIADITGSYSDEELSFPNRIGAMVMEGDTDISAICHILDNCGFFLAEENSYYQITGDMLRDNKYLDSPKVLKKMSDMKLVPLKDLSKKMFRSLLNELYEKVNLKGIDMEALDGDISYFGIVDDKIISCILFAKESDGYLYNQYLYQNPDIGLSERLIYLIAKSAQAIRDKYPEDIIITFLTMNETSEKLVKNIFADAKKTGSLRNYEFAFGYDENAIAARMNDELSFEPVREDFMVCKGCRFTTGNAIECKKYLQKPDGVVSGGECPLFES